MATDFEPISRRSVLLAATGLTTVGVSLAHGVGRIDDPRTCALGQVKLNATLDDSPALWVYSGFIYAVRPQRKPLPILALCGLQVNWATRRDDGSYQLAAPLLSFFRDIDSGAYLDEFANPFTNSRNPVRPNYFAPRGHAVYPADGSAMRLSGQIGASESAPQGFKPADSTVGIGRVVWSETRESIVLSTDQFFDVERRAAEFSSSRWRIARHPHRTAEVPVLMMGRVGSTDSI